MAYAMKERERKVVIWGALIAIPALLFTFAFKPLRATLVDKREQLEFERDALARERAAIAAAKRSPALQHIADSLMQTTSTRLFSSSDDVMASAELGTYIRELAERNHFLLTTATTGAVPKAKGVVRTLSDDIRGESDLQGVLEFLHALESGPRLVRVSRIDISRPTRDADDIETVLFAATITGYALPPEPVVPFNTPRGKDSTSTAADSVGAKSRAATRDGTP
ncbi:MAG: hypothetical protein ABI120_22510 [Gemmatimonadaceae bacterium]